VSPRAVRALVRAAWYTARSYRLSLVLSLGSLVLTVVPLYFVAGALQPIAARSIAPEGGHYFSFMLVGNFALSLVAVSVNTLPAAISGGLSSGYFESLLLTPASRASLMVGLASYSWIWTAVRGVCLLAAGALLGAQIGWGRAPAALVIVILIVAAHFGIGLIGAAMMIAFRTTGPLSQGVFFVSALFGGAYYATSVIPSWLETISLLTPLSYGLRALRRVLLSGDALAPVLQDLLMLSAFGLALGAAGVVALSRALRHARRAGTLNTY
jgi:ABC-2 type transport system permease protein